MKNVKMKNVQFKPLAIHANLHIFFSKKSAFALLINAFT
jgi:hypothetical protein